MTPVEPVEPDEGETREVLLIPEGIFTRDELRERREHLFGHGVRSRLEYFDEHPGGPYYRLTLIGLAHEMSWASLSFSFFDDCCEFLGRYV